MSERRLKPEWRTWRFEQMATNVNDRIDDPSQADVEYYVGLEHLDPDSLKTRRWESPSDVEATKLRFRKGDIIFGRRRAYQRKLAVADFDGICSAHAMVLRARPEVVIQEFLPFFMQSDTFMERAQAISVGSLSPTINWKTLAREEFALPPLGEDEIPGACYQKSLHRLRPYSDGDQPEYLLHCLRYCSRTGRFIAETGETTIPHLAAERPRAMLFPFPPASEQLEIVESMRHIDSTLEALAQRAAQTRFLLNSLATAQLGEV